MQDFKANASTYTALADIALIAAKVNPDITNFIDNVVPKIADEDINGATNDVLYLLQRKTGNQYLDPNLKIYFQNRFRTSTELIVRKDYPNLVLVITEFALAMDNYIKHGIIPN